MSNSVRPHRRQPTRLPRPWGSPGKNTGVGCHLLLQCMKVKVKSLSRVWLFMTPWTAAHQAPPSMGFSRQEHWSGVPLPSPVLGAKSANYSKGLYRISAVCNNILKMWKSSLGIRKELLTQTCFTKTLLLGQSHFRYHPPSLGLWFSFAGRESDW